MLDVDTKTITEKATIIAIVLEMLGTNSSLKFVGDYKKFLQVSSIAEKTNEILLQVIKLVSIILCVIIR